MCTIGGVVQGGRIILFKNCDLVKKIKFFKPRLFRGKYGFIGFTRGNRPGIWAGINELGLGIVAADTHVKKKYRAKPQMINNIFRAYKDAIANHASVDDAKNFLKKFYEKNVSVPDLIIIGDRKKLCAIEFVPGKWKVKCVKFGFIVRSNHFLLLKGALPRKDDISSYLRYETTWKMLKSDSSLSGIKRLCRSHENGPSENSICRHGGKYEYTTQASAIMVADNKVITYRITNNFPCKGEYKTFGLRA